MRAVSLGLGLSAILLAAACGKKATDEVVKKPPPAPVKVPLATAVAMPTPQHAVLSGLVVADQRAEVTADTQGKTFL